MKAQDLRLKNIVYNRNGDPIKLSIYNLQCILSWEIYEHAGEPPFKPIPLTEEWLDKFGFEKSYVDFFYHKKLGSMLFSRPFKEASHILVKCNVGCKLTSIKYVHQCQNLYHTITGEELTIKN